MTLNASISYFSPLGPSNPFTDSPPALHLTDFHPPHKNNM